MDTEETVILDTEDQDADTGVDSDTNDSSDDSTTDTSTDERYENQKRRAEKAETEAKELKAKLAELSGTKEPEQPKKEPVNKPDSERLDRMELRQEGFAPEVIDEIMKLGGVKALSNPLIKSAATEMQAKHTAEQAADITDGPQSQTRTKYSTEDLKNMSAAEMEKILPHAE